jgi:hypothetical protein
MNTLRPVIATVLALWLGFLACVLGCAPPVLASTSSHTQVSEPRAAVSEGDSDKMVDDRPCCHHHHGASEQNNQGLQTITCGPLDATLIQKQDPVSSKSAHPFAAVSMLFVFNSSSGFSATNGISAPTVWHAGRDALLQIHVLRI